LVSIVAFLLSPPLPPPRSTLFPYTTLFRSLNLFNFQGLCDQLPPRHIFPVDQGDSDTGQPCPAGATDTVQIRVFVFRGLEVKHRSEEHTSELQSRFDLVCRLLLEKKKQPQC